MIELSICGSGEPDLFRLATEIENTCQTAVKYYSDLHSVPAELSGRGAVLLVTTAILAVHYELQALYEAAHRGAHVLAVGEASHAELSHLLRLGLAGQIVPDSPVQVVSKAIQAVRRGEIWVSRSLMCDALRGALSLLHNAKLTRREVEVLQRAASGLNNRQIADELFISRETVRWHLRSAYTKLGVHDRRSAVEFL